MNSSTTSRDTSAKSVSKELRTTFPANKHIASRQSPSFSSSASLSSCSFSNFLDESPQSPATPLRFLGIPFSWEQLPGIPKKQSHKKKASTTPELLPLPPPAIPPSRRFNFEPVRVWKKNSNIDQDFLNDPFIAALVVCSKGDDHDQESTSGDLWSSDGNKVSRSVSDRFGFINLNSSCKSTCDVSESIVYLPRSSRSSYDLITRRTR